MVTTQLSPTDERLFGQQHARSEAAVVIEKDTSFDDSVKQIDDFIERLKSLDEKDVWPRGICAPCRVEVSHDGTVVLDLMYREILSVSDAHLGSKNSKKLLQKILTGVGVHDGVYAALTRRPSGATYSIAISGETVMEKQDKDGNIVHVVRRGERPASRWVVVYG